ncbi:MAG: DNA repair protein RadC [Prolixibacteraceae bacterium]|nr:DNA repair protein RadC [Prolixibacteraceae bacterium]
MEEYKKLNIKDWALEDRPREKLMANGPRSLSDAELVAILIGSGNPKETAVELSRRILSSVNNDLNELGLKSLGYLTNFNGIGEAKAINILAALELGKRRKEASQANRSKITCSKDVAEIFSPLLEDLPHEEFWILLLNRGNKVIDKQMVSQGGISGTVIDTRLIMKMAIEKLASSIILCHNHPSGTLEASDADMKITQKLKQAGEIMDIPILDHIIIGLNKYYSFADEGIL